MSVDTYSVSEISQVIRDQMALVFPSELWIRGQIQNLKRAQSGHVYFDLVSADAGDDLLGVTLFSATKRQVNEQLKRGGGVRMTDGTEVRIRGRLEWFGPRGRVQLRMSDIDPEFTLGRIESEREQLLIKLKAEGLLDANGRRPVPDRARAHRSGHQRAEPRPSTTSSPSSRRAASTGACSWCTPRSRVPAPNTRWPVRSEPQKLPVSS